MASTKKPPIKRLNLALQPGPMPNSVDLVSLHDNGKVDWFIARLDAKGIRMHTGIEDPTFPMALDPDSLSVKVVKF